MHAAKDRLPRVLFISTAYPEPASTGKKIVLSGLCRYFEERVGGENFKLVCTDQIPSPSKWNASSLQVPSARDKLVNILWHTLIRRRKSLQESLLYSPALQQQIDRLVLEYRPDILLFDTVRMGQYAEKLPRGREKRIVYLDDLFSVRYERMLKTFDLASGYSFDPLANFSRHVPGIGRWAVQRAGFLKRWLLQFEGAVVRRSEDRQVPQFDLALLVSPEEVNTLKLRLGADNVFELPPKLKIDEPDTANRSWHGKPEFVFLGSLNLPHNAVSIEHFLSTQFESVRRKIPGVRLRIIGQHPSSHLSEMIGRFGESISLEGYVPDVRSVLQQCCGMIVPLLFGSGVKLKVIDALACGTPIVSTAYGVEGIAFRSGDHGFLEDNPDGFAEAMSKLLDPALNQSMSRACKEFFEAYYSDRSVRAKYDAYFLSSDAAATGSGP